MESTLFYVGLYFLVSLLHLASSKVDSYNGWKNSPNVQYHIQTDEGEERYFKYQTKSGQYRKEKRLQDGTVVGTYGWVDPNGYLRLRDYIADNQGYRILKTKMVYVGGNSVTGDSASGYYHTKYSPLPSVTFQFPLETQPPHRFDSYSPPKLNAYVPPSGTSYLPPYFAQSSYQNSVTKTPPPTQSAPPINYPSYFPTSNPQVEISPNSIPKTSTVFYFPSTSTPAVAIFKDPTPKPTAVYATTPKPVAANYVTTPSPVSVTSATAIYSSTSSPFEQTTLHAIAAIGEVSSTTPPPPVSGKFAHFNGNNNFITETEKNKLFFQNENESNYFSKGSYRQNFEEYDGIATVQNGFRYYLPRHYHEEQSSSNGQERAGSFGYIDPFGIRRVIYYNTSPGKGFLHRKNNRYVGFDATPYDPRPNF